MSPAKEIPRLAWPLVFWARSLFVPQIVTYLSKLLLRASPANEMPAPYWCIISAEDI